MSVPSAGAVLTRQFLWSFPYIAIGAGLLAGVGLAGLQSGRHTGEFAPASLTPASTLLVQNSKMKSVVAKTHWYRDPVGTPGATSPAREPGQRSRVMAKADSLIGLMDERMVQPRSGRRLASVFMRGNRTPSRLGAQPFLAHVRLPGTNDQIVIRPAALYTRRTGFSEARKKALDKRRAASERCLSQAIYFEARGEPTLGQIAVANVVMNRVRSPYYPDNVCAVVYQNYKKRMRCQFTFACDGLSDQPRDPKAWKKSQKIARQVLDGKKRLSSMSNALFYHADYVRPDWSRKFRTVKRIGKHIFYRNQNWAPLAPE